MSRPYLLVQWEPGSVTIEGTRSAMAGAIPLVETAARQAFTIPHDIPMGEKRDEMKYGAAMARVVTRK